MKPWRAGPRVKEPARPFWLLKKAGCFVQQPAKYQRLPWSYISPAAFGPTVLPANTTKATMVRM